MPSSPFTTGILLTNVGTPKDTTTKSVRRYLKEFLSDPRIIDFPRWFWLPLLHGIILNTRPARSAQLYKNIWTEKGSPLLDTTEAIARGLEKYIQENADRKIIVRAGMRYGHPSIAEALTSLERQGVEEVVILPLFPQFSTTTTSSTYDAVSDHFRRQAALPRVISINHYYDDPGYLSALAGQVRTHWKEHGQSERLLFSFHGIPKRYAKREPYEAQCLATAKAVAGQLGLQPGEWQAAFQSRFGPEEWVQPYTDEVLEAWGQEGVEGVCVIAPGFAADCLETIDELGREGRETFQEAGGGSFVYIPALNDSPQHINVLAGILKPYLKI